MLKPVSPDAGSGPGSDEGSAPTAGSGPAAGAPGPTEWLTVPDVAERLDVSVTRVHQLIRDGALLAVRRDGVWKLPADLVAGPQTTGRSGGPAGGNLARHLAGVLTVLRDAGYSDEEALRWLYTPDDTLPGTPAAALRERPTEVKRRAQALGF